MEPRGSIRIHDRKLQAKMFEAWADQRGM
ncbi:MAG: hypothetical protein ACLTK0_02730 [Anaerovoracaceae bacterium]